MGAGKQRLADFREKTSRGLAVQLQSHGRMELRLDGRAFPLANASRILARYENHGHLLLWPNGESYRVLAAGSLAALLREGRPDVTPLVLSEAAAKPAADHLGYVTRAWHFETKRGELLLLQADVPEAGFGGPLLCRFLLEWLSIAPSAIACEEGAVPVRAEIVTSDGGRLVFAVTKLEARSETPASRLIETPPQDAHYRKYGLPGPTAILSDVDLSALRASSTTGILTAYNNNRVPAYLLLDGTAVALIPPHASVSLSGISSGDYEAEQVDFFGDQLLPPTALRVDRSATVGKPSSGRDGGTTP